MNEIWLPIPEYEGLYECSSLGNFRSLNYNHTGKVVGLCKGGFDYATVVLVKAGERKQYRVARIIAAVHIGPPPNAAYQVNHKDRNILNDCVDNLEWLSPSENTMHSYETGTHAKQKAIRQLTMDGVYITTFRGTREAARQLNAPNGHTGIAAVARGERPSAYGYRWLYEEEK